MRFDSKFGSSYSSVVLRTCVIALALASSGAVQAQETPDTAKKGNGRRTDVREVLSQEQVARLSVDRKRQLADAGVAFIRDAFSELVTASEVPMREKDLVRFNCMESKIQQVKALLRIAERSSTEMSESFRSGVETAGNSAFQRIQLAGTKTESLYRDALDCVGVNAVYTGNTQIDVIREGVGESDIISPLPPPPGPSLPPTASRI